MDILFWQKIELDTASAVIICEQESWEEIQMKLIEKELTEKENMFYRFDNNLFCHKSFIVLIEMNDFNALLIRFVQIYFIPMIILLIALPA